MKDTRNIGEPTGGDSIDGFIKEYRSIIDHWVFQDAYTYKVWKFILHKAAFKTYKKPCKGTMVTLNPGQLIYGRPEWSDRLNIKEGKLRNIIDLLIQDQMINVTPVGRRFSIMTVLNWNRYNGSDEDDSIFIPQNEANQTTNETTNSKPSNTNDPINSNSQANNQLNNQQTTNRQPNKKNIKKDNNYKNNKDICGASPQTSKFTPPSIEEVSVFCKERNNNVDAERFVNFYSSKGWMVGKNKMKNWKCAVLTWEKGSNYNAPSNTPKSNRNMDQREYGDSYYEDFFTNTKGAKI